jgi:hypothetical protein
VLSLRDRLVEGRKRISIATKSFQGLGQADPCLGELGLDHQCRPEGRFGSLILARLQIRKREVAMRSRVLGIRGYGLTIGLQGAFKVMGRLCGEPMLDELPGPFPVDFV